MGSKVEVLWLKRAVTVGPKLGVLWPDTEVVRKLRGQIIWENLFLSSSDFKSVGLCSTESNPGLLWLLGTMVQRGKPLKICLLMVHFCNSCTQEAESKDCHEFLASVGSTANANPARAVERDPGSASPTKTKIKQRVVFPFLFCPA